jgi:hypothetical protein
VDPDPFQDNADVAGLEREMEDVPISEDGGGDGVEAPESPPVEAPTPAEQSMEAAGRPPKPLGADFPMSPPGSPRPQVFAKPSVRPSFGLGGRANSAFNAAVSYGVQAAVSREVEKILRKQGDADYADAADRYAKSPRGSAGEKDALAVLLTQQERTEAAVAGLVDADEATQRSFDAKNEFLAQPSGLQNLGRIDEEIARQKRRIVEELRRDAAGSGDYQLAVVAARVGATATTVRDRSTQISAELTRKNQGDRVREAERHARDAESRAAAASETAKTKEDVQKANALWAAAALAKSAVRRERAHARSPEGRRAYAERKKAAKEATREARRAAKEAKRASKAAAAAARYGSTNRAALEAKAKAAEEKAKAAQEKAENLLRQLDDPDVPLLPGWGPTGEVPPDSPESETVECDCDPPCPEGYRCDCQCVLDPKAEEKPNEEESWERKGKGKQAPPLAPGDTGFTQAKEAFLANQGIMPKFVQETAPVPVPKSVSNEVNSVESQSQTATVDANSSIDLGYVYVDLGVLNDKGSAVYADYRSEVLQLYRSLGGGTNPIAIGLYEMLLREKPPDAKWRVSSSDTATPETESRGKTLSDVRATRDPKSGALVVRNQWIRVYFGSRRSGQSAIEWSRTSGDMRDSVEAAKDRGILPMTYHHERTRAVISAGIAATQAFLEGRFRQIQKTSVVPRDFDGTGILKASVGSNRANSLIELVRREGMADAKGFSSLTRDDIKVYSWMLAARLADIDDGALDDLVNSPLAMIRDYDPRWARIQQLNPEYVRVAWVPGFLSEVRPDMEEVHKRLARTAWSRRMEEWREVSAYLSPGARRVNAGIDRPQNADLTPHMPYYTETASDVVVMAVLDAMGDWPWRNAGD